MLSPNQNFDMGFCCGAFFMVASPAVFYASQVIGDIVDLNTPATAVSLAITSALTMIFPVAVAAVYLDERSEHSKQSQYNLSQAFKGWLVGVTTFSYSDRVVGNAIDLVM